MHGSNPSREEKSEQVERSESIDLCLLSRHHVPLLVPRGGSQAFSSPGPCLSEEENNVQCSGTG